MSYHYECDPDKREVDNIEAAMITVVGPHKEIRDQDVVRVLSAVVDDLRQMLKRQPVKKHRLSGPLRMLFDNVMSVCTWYLDEDEEEGESKERANRPYRSLTFRQFYDGIRKYRNDCKASEFLTCVDFTRAWRQENGYS